MVEIRGEIKRFPLRAASAQPDSDLQQLIEAWPNLTVEQKRIIAAIVAVSAE